MDIIRRSQFQTVPWNNGGGITHEVAREDQDGKLLWRLSLAEVGRDGPFSLFPGLARILTVIDGPGMDLISPRGTLVHELPLLRPVYFSGDEELAAGSAPVPASTSTSSTIRTSTTARPSCSRTASSSCPHAPTSRACFVSRGRSHGRTTPCSGTTSPSSPRRIRRSGSTRTARRSASPSRPDRPNKKPRHHWRVDRLQIRCCEISPWLLRQRARLPLPRRGRQRRRGLRHARRHCR